jgi:ribosome-binding protein aMBF1 (putative translation factor)
MSLQTTNPFAQFGAANAWPTPGATNVHAYPQIQQQTASPQSSEHVLPVWADDEEMRHEYMLACLEQDIAWQVRINRERRGWTQKQLASMLGTRQSAVARAEDPAYGRLSLSTLTKVAKAFRCALSLRFVPYEKFMSEIEDTSEDALFVKGYRE